MSAYGVPQRRKRFIVVATLSGIAGKIFTELENGRRGFLVKRNLQERNTVIDALSDLEYGHGTTPSPDTKGFMAGIVSESRSPLQDYLRIGKASGYIPDSHRFVNHTDKTVALFSELLKKADRNKCIVGEARAKYGVKKRFVTVLDPCQPSPTLTTIPDDLIHYSEPRVMTVRECARLQTFPDWFEFKGRYTTGNSERVRSAPRYTQVGNAVPPLFAEQLGLAIQKVIENE
jgi:DNA (cytosine-5)-methyltransferase 1